MAAMPIDMMRGTKSAEEEEANIYSNLNVTREKVLVQRVFVFVLMPCVGLCVCVCVCVCACVRDSDVPSTPNI